MTDAYTHCSPGAVTFQATHPLQYTTMPLKLAAALVKAQAQVKAAGKTGDNTFDRYKYSKLEDFFDVAKVVLERNGLALVMETMHCEPLEDRQTKNGGKEHAVRVRLAGTLIHESGESLRVYGYGEGQDRADKSIYKAITGGKKYLLAGILSIPTTDDPEADEKVGLTSGAKKEDSKGVAKTKVPKWLDDQVKEAGGYIGAIRELLIAAGKDLLSADMAIKQWRADHKYDEPADVIDALAVWKNTLTEGSV